MLNYLSKQRWFDYSGNSLDGIHRRIEPLASQSEQSKHGQAGETPIRICEPCTETAKGHPAIVLCSGQLGSGIGRLSLSLLLLLD